MAVVGPSILKEAYKPRPEWAHKGQFGKLLMVAGSERHTGSPVFCGLAASRAGCDLVYLASPRRPADIAALHPSIITEPLGGSMLKLEHVHRILDLAKEVRATAILIGPGLWRENETFQAILQIIEQTDLPMVIDADAIRAVGTNPIVLAHKNIVLTPHADEFRALTGNTPSQEIKERTEKVRLAANELGTTILLKGAVDIISDGDFVALNRTHTNLMTKGGMGDTLAGICGALLARGMEPYMAAQAAAYINGKAGMLAASEFGEGMMPKDLIERIPKAIKSK
ncbi:MAG: NAD(P)H-hydrate dehydratase [Candidatus Aenigmatarchaeota archaeon]